MRELESRRSAQLGHSNGWPFGEYVEVCHPLMHQGDRVLALENLENLFALRCILIFWCFEHI